MASISSVGGSSNSISSLYNSANIISGLASGLDTEGMIESLVQSYQNKIQSLYGKATKLEWKQDSYRNLITLMNSFASKYTSYTSTTNLMSASFFNSAVKVATQGKNNEKVTASGRTDSDVVLNGVSQLATAARYITRGNGLTGDTGNEIAADGTMNFEDKVTLGTLNGSLSFSYGNKTVSISFDEVNDKIGLDYDGNPVSLTREQKTAKLGELITEKLSNEKITLSNGDTVSADTRIGVKVDEKTGKISFYDKSGAGNSVYISSASDSIKDTLKLGNLNDKDKPVKSIGLSSSTAFTKNVNAYEYLSGKSFNISLDGASKTIQMPQIKKVGDEYQLTMPSTVKDKYGNVSYVYDTSKLDKDKYTVTKQGATKTVSSSEIADTYTEMIQSGVKDAFGSKLTVTNEAAGTGGLSLKFEAADGSNLLINASTGETLGIGRTATNYLNTSSTLGDLMKSSAWGDLSGMEAKDADGNVKQDKNGNPLYEFKLNGVLIGEYSKDSKLSDIMNDINTSDAGVKVTYSKTTREFVFNTKDTGSESKIELGDGLARVMFGGSSGSGSGNFAEAYGLDLGDGESKSVTFDTPGGKLTFEVTNADSMEDIAEKMNKTLPFFGYTASYNKTSGQLILTNDSGKMADFKVTADGEELEPEFDSTYVSGQDAKFQVTVNGTTKELTRGSNSVDIDGMTINFHDTFNYDEGTKAYGTDSTEFVSFKTTTDSDKIVDAVKDMITDYNEMMAELRKAYATMPYQDSSGSLKTYEPLTEEQKSTMSESEIKNYEERAKQGLLFGDSNLRSLYEQMRSILQPSGSDAAMLAKIGIGTAFSATDNSTTITLDEKKFREALENDLDGVADLFTRSTDSGAATNGIMQSMKVQLDRYAGLTGSVKGILVQQAGTPLNSLSLLDNQWQKQIDSINTEIEKWQDKLEAQVDRYTSMFSRLEVLINQMNSQSSTLAGLMGG